MNRERGAEGRGRVFAPAAGLCAVSDESDWSTNEEWASASASWRRDLPTTIHSRFAVRRAYQVLLILGLAACQDGTKPVGTTGQTTQAPIAPEGFGGPFKPRPLGTGAVKVGPPRGTVIVIGGGGQGPEVYKAFIDRGQGLLAFGEIFVFVAILAVGLAYVWVMGDLEWVKALKQEVLQTIKERAAAASEKKAA